MNQQQGPTMKNNILLIASILFFTVVNTTFLWSNWLGPAALILFMFMVIVYIIIGFLWFWVLFDLLGKDNKPRKDIIVLLFGAFVLGTSFLFPSGMVPLFKESASRSILTATAEGAANCMSYFYLVDETHFAENTVCFGTNHMGGNYVRKDDTLYFELTEVSRQDDTAYYQFAVFQNDTFQGQPLNGSTLLFYDDYNDTNPRRLWVREK